MALTLSGCGSGSLGGNDVTLRLVAAEYGAPGVDSSQDYWDTLVREFEAGNPGIEVEVTITRREEADKQVAEMAERGEAPDMAQISSYAEHANEGRLYRTDQLLSIPAQADILPALAKTGEVGHIQYGLPFAASTRLFFYNKKLFEEAGIEEAPRTWEDVRSNAAVLKEMGVSMPCGLPLGPEEPQAETLMWMLSGDGGYIDDIGTYALDSAQNIRTFQWLRDNLVTTDLTGGNPASTNRREVFEAFTKGEVGMLDGSTTLLRQPRNPGVEYGIVPMPGRTGRASATVGVTDWMMAFKQNGHREEIGRFLEFAYQKKNVLRFADQYDLLPVTNSASEAMRADPEYTHLWDFLDQQSTAAYLPAHKTSWPQLSKSISKKIGSAVQPGSDPADVLGPLQREALTAEGAPR
jgi:multiple sugar transport system substrate-binding protein